MPGLFSIQKSIAIIALCLTLLFLYACEPQPVVAQAADTDAPPPAEVETDSRVFPSGQVEVTLPLPANVTTLTLQLPYSEELIPQPGDEAVIENEVNGVWQETGRARVTAVADQQISLRRSQGHLIASKRLRIKASAVHRCDLAAASAIDTRAVVEGVAVNDIDISAIEFCSQAASKYAQTPRFHFQLGRALDAHRQAQRAVTAYRYALALAPDYAAALLALAGKYLLADGLDKNEAEALRLLRKAHEQGLARATYLLGHMAEQGHSTAPADPQAARAFYMQAAQAGDVSAQLSMARLLEQDTDLPANSKLALDWYERAAEQGHLDSQLRVARAYQLGQQREQSWSEASKWWQRAAHQGSPQAQIALGEIFEAGHGLDNKNLDKAMYWYRMAATQGDAWGQYHVGRMYALGLAVSKNMDTATEWLLMARAQGVRQANQWLPAELSEPVSEPDSDEPDAVEMARNPVVDDSTQNSWSVQVQGYMSAACREALIDELIDLEVNVVEGNAAYARLVITMNEPEYYNSSMGPFSFDGYRIHYRAELIRNRDNIRLLYVYGQEDGDDKNESCVDAIDEIGDELDDQLD